MDRAWLSTVSKILVTAGAILVVAAIVAPNTASSLLSLGLALWPMAALAKVTRHYLRRDPLPGRSGTLINERQPPFSYHLGYAVSVAMFSLMTFVAIRSYLAA